MITIVIITWLHALAVHEKQSLKLHDCDVFGAVRCEHSSNGLSRNNDPDTSFKHEMFLIWIPSSHDTLQAVHGEASQLQI